MILTHNHNDDIYNLIFNELGQLETIILIPAMRTKGEEVEFADLPPYIREGIVKLVQDYNEYQRKIAEGEEP